MKIKVPARMVTTIKIIGVLAVVAILYYTVVSTIASNVVKTALREAL